MATLKICDLCGGNTKNVVTKLQFTIPAEMSKPQGSYEEKKFSLYSHLFGGDEPSNNGPYFELCHVCAKNLLLMLDRVKAVYTAENKSIGYLDISEKSACKWFNKIGEL